MDLSIFNDSWEMHDLVEDIVNEAVKVAPVAFEKNIKAIQEAWIRVKEALEIVDEESFLVLDEMYSNFKTENRYIESFKESVIAFAEYVVDIKPVIEKFLNEIYLGGKDPVDIWVYLIYIFAFYIFGTKFSNEYGGNHSLLETDEYVRISKWVEEQLGN